MSYDPPAISIVIPTLGRPSLGRMVGSLQPQLQSFDEIIVVADGMPAARRCLPHVDGVRYMIHRDPRSAYGNAQRNYGRLLSRGNVVWFCDDDDIALPGALQAIRAAFSTERRPTIFRIEHLGDVLWHDQEIAQGNVAGVAMVIPNESRFPGFSVPTDDPELSDKEWIAAVNSIESVAWNTAVIYRCEQHNHGRLAIL